MPDNDVFTPELYKQCTCDHKMQGTGAVFFYSLGWLYCNECRGWQRIRKMIG